MSEATFRKGEPVIIYDGTKRRNSIELAEIGADSGYSEDTVLISFGAFNVRQSKTSVHKLPATLKRAIKAAS